MQRLLEHKSLLFLAFLYTIIITWLSTARIFIPIEVGVEDSDKIGHLLAYIVFTTVWFFFFFYSKKLKNGLQKSLLYAAVLSFLYGVLMEGCQAVFTDYRSPDLKDVIANTIGTIIAIIILKMFEGSLKKLKGKQGVKNI